MPKPLKLHTARELQDRPIDDIAVPAEAGGHLLPAWPRPTTPVYLYVRNRGKRATLTVPSVMHGMVTMTVRKAASRGKPTDYTLGPLGPGKVTYTSGPGGLSVFAYAFIPDTPEGGATNA